MLRSTEHKISKHNSSILFIFQFKKKKIRTVFLCIFVAVDLFWEMAGCWLRFIFCTEGSVFNGDSVSPYSPLKLGALELPGFVFS